MRQHATKSTASAVLLFLFLLLFSLSVTASNYTHAGNGAYYRDATGGLFTADEDFVAKGLTDGALFPLVGDLNGDGTNEIVVIEEANVRIYQSELLTVIDAYAIPAQGASNQFSDMALYDIDADGLREIIILTTEQKTGWGGAYIYSFNGTVITQDYNYTYQNAYNPEQSSIVCDEQGGGFCVVASNSGGNTNSELIFHYFDESGFDNFNVSIAGISSVGGERCLSPFGSGAYADHDNDGDYDFFFTTYERDASRVRVHVVDESSGTLSVSDLVSRQEGAPRNDVGTFRCEQGIGWSATQPLIYDFDGAPSNGDEIIIGVNNYPNNEFKMYSFTANGVYIDEYPEILTAEGRFMSNVFRMNAFGDTGVEDFCVMGYSTTNPDDDLGVVDGEIDLLCASIQTGQTPQTEEFVFETPAYNLTFSDATMFQNKAWITHAGDFRSSLETGGGATTNLDEVITSLGIFWLDWNGGLLGTNTLEALTLFENTIQGATIPVDVQGYGRSDVISLTTNNIYYFDDGFSFSGCAVASNPCIRDGSSVDPSPEAVIKQNSTLKVTLKLADIDGDDVAGRVTIYSGAPNEQTSGWSSYYSSGTTLTITDANTSNPFIFNQTGTFNLVIEARDEREPTSIETITLPFTISATTGIVQGDAVLSIGESPDEANASAQPTIGSGDLATNQGNNSIQNGLAWAKDRTNLGYTALWILVMAGFLIFVVVELKASPMTLPIILIGEVFLLILGFVLGFIGLGTLLSVIVVVVIAGGFTLTNKLMGGGG